MNLTAKHVFLKGFVLSISPCFIKDSYLFFKNDGEKKRQTIYKVMRNILPLQ